jgi:hypothetical protein
MISSNENNCSYLLGDRTRDLQPYSMVYLSEEHVTCSFRLLPASRFFLALQYTSLPTFRSSNLASIRVSSRLLVSTRIRFGQNRVGRLGGGVYRETSAWYDLSSNWDVTEVMARNLNGFCIIREATLDLRYGHDL